MKTRYELGHWSGRLPRLIAVLAFASVACGGHGNNEANGSGGEDASSTSADLFRLHHGHPEGGAGAADATATGDGSSEDGLTGGGSGGAAEDAASTETVGTDAALPEPTGTATATPPLQGCSGNSPALAASRQTVWQPGVTYNGGIPNRTTICASLSPAGGGQDDTAAINAALSSCPAGQVVSLAAGTFTITGQGLVVPANVTLRGAVDSTGRPASLLVKDDGDSQPYSVISMGLRYASLKFKTPPSSTDPATGGTLLASDAVKGTNQLTLVSNPGLQVGEIVYVDMATDPSLTYWNLARSPGGGQTADPSRGWFSNYDRPITQILEVQSISGNTITFTTPFHISFTTADGAALWELEWPATFRAGVENVYAFGGTGGDGGGGIHFFSCAYCWAKNVEVDHTDGTGVNFDDSFRCELRDSYIHHAGPWSGPSPGGGAYLTGMSAGTSDSLFENNVVWNGNKIIVMRATGGGNVVAYNYMQDAWGATYPSEPETGLNASHMTTPHYELFEGNESFAFGSDSVWGNSIDITVLRNNLTGLRSATPPLYSYNYTLSNGCTLYYEDVQNRAVVELSAYSNEYSFLGNVLGYSGEAPVVQRSGGCIGGATGGFEYTFANDNMIPMWELDSTVDPTIQRDGNYDYATGTQHWDNPGTTIPNSLYLCSAPPFFGSSQWPWVDPETGTVAVLPAKARWQAMVAANTHVTPLDLAQAGF